MNTGKIEGASRPNNRAFSSRSWIWRFIILLFLYCVATMWIGSFKSIQSIKSFHERAHSKVCCYWLCKMLNMRFIPRTVTVDIDLNCLAIYVLHRKTVLQVSPFWTYYTLFLLMMYCSDRLLGVYLPYEMFRCNSWRSNFWISPCHKNTFGIRLLLTRVRRSKLGVRDKGTRDIWVALV